MKIQNSDFYTILPESYKNTEIQCVSYAISKAIARLCKKAQDIKVMAGINELSENILDYLAVELRAPYYSQELSRAEKAGIVASTLPWYMEAGTKNALEKLLQRIYGGGEVTEWFDYSDNPGQPYHFRVKVSSSNNAFDSEDFTETLLSIIAGTKNARSILDGIGLMCEISTAENSAPFIGHALHQNIIRTGTCSNFCLVIGSDSFNAEVENIINGGTFDDPAETVLDCGIF